MQNCSIIIWICKKFLKLQNIFPSRVPFFILFYTEDKINTSANLTGRLYCGFKVPMTRNFTPNVYDCIVKITYNDLIISFIEFW